MSEAPAELRIDALGIETRAWQYGDRHGEPSGETIILVHGFRGDHHGLAGIAAALVEHRPGIRVVVPDLPGFGASPAIPGREHDLALYGEWLRAFAREAAPGGYSILGHSFGSLVVAAALDQGLDPSTVALINPISSPALEGPQAVMTRLAIFYYWAADRLPERAARALLGNPVIVRLMSIVMAKTPDPALRAWIHGQHDRYFSRFADTSTLLEAFRASVSHTVAEYAAAITQPVLLIVGDRDDITPLPAQLGLQRQLADSRLRVMPGVGHLVHYEAVEPAVAALAKFLREHSERSADVSDTTGERR
ncbi:alpha/beta fold hydrolase [Leucobacter soli]|uniref:2-succinyl-6-hydroxy-2, 4-cyclohexadiene-1-carboxylate synthase n=1 Tax=Leucobacter soli TaxID=2812850 RepID=A0A916NM09_9MICO|nr:alpha/beta hydrolase [Leucobacter soli]CAG7603121.1 2-succinyl-6-hydroxy-2, 4-cyclohexadiene-1-carboxylate synthase [Leucobacter soli]